MADFYWVGAGSTYAWNEQSGPNYINWATTSGGSTHPTSLPTTGDSVYFDTNSGTNTPSSGPASALSLATFDCNTNTLAISSGITTNITVTSTLVVRGGNSHYWDGTVASTCTTITLGGGDSGGITVNGMINVGGGVNAIFDDSVGSLTATIVVASTGSLDVNSAICAPTVTGTGRVGINSEWTGDASGMSGAGYMTVNHFGGGSAYRVVASGGHWQTGGSVDTLEISGGTLDCQSGSIGTVNATGSTGIVAGNLYTVNWNASGDIQDTSAQVNITTLNCSVNCSISQSGSGIEISTAYVAASKTLSLSGTTDGVNSVDHIRLQGKTSQVTQWGPFDTPDVTVDESAVVTASKVLTGNTNLGESGTLTLPATGNVLSDSGTYGIGGTGSTPALTLPTANNVSTVNGNYGNPSSPVVPTLVLTSIADVVTALKSVLMSWLPRGRGR